MRTLWAGTEDEGELEAAPSGVPGGEREESHGRTQRGAPAALPIAARRAMWTRIWERLLAAPAVDPSEEAADPDAARNR
jgi:hypothetical protein